MDTWKAKLHRDSEWQEWQVRVSINGKSVRDLWYHTDDKEDAIMTMRIMIEEARFEGYKVIN